MTGGVLGDIHSICGSEELNGTYDMMGNLREWMETPYNSPGYSPSAPRVMRGGLWAIGGFFTFHFLERDANNAPHQGVGTGFRVASIPEPDSITLLVCGALTGLMWWRRRR